jgi:DNA-binding MarR family transcriptional regulator
MALMLLKDRPGQTATELGEGLNMTKASLTGILDELELKKLVRREADAEDRRKSRLSLTDKGRKSAEALSGELQALLAARLAPLAEAEREALARHLSAAQALLSKL